MVWDIAAVVALVLSATALWLTLSTLREFGNRDPLALSPLVRRVLMIREIPLDTVAAFAEARPDHDRIAFIVNPTKAGVAQLREAAYRACSLRYLPEPIWLHTSQDDSGVQAARDAAEAGADLLVAVGGDGTVRATAKAALEHGLPMGLIPMGTGNLLARNINVPVGDPSDALRNVLDGTERKIDVGWLELYGEEGEPRRELFLVVAGVGIDADIFANVDDSLKRNLGWLAYYLSAVKFFGAKRMRASVALDGGEPKIDRMRSVLMANCGKLPAGITLVADAKLDDGELDFLTVDSRGGLGWASLFGDFVAQGAGIPSNRLVKSWRISSIDHVRGTTADVHTELPQRVQADGDDIGRAVRVVSSVDKRALRVRTRGSR